MTEKKESFIHPNAFHIYSDGSFRPPNCASCAYLIFSQKSLSVVKASRWACRGRTINQMELEAINKALDFPGMQHVIIYSDSNYSILSLTIWKKAWEQNGWKSNLGEPIKNKELIIEISEKLAKMKYVRFCKVKGHSGDPFNSMVDYLAQGISKKMVEDMSLPDGEYPV